MVSDVAGQVNVFVCVAVVLGLLVFRWRDAAHKTYGEAPLIIDVDALANYEPPKQETPDGNFQPGGEEEETDQDSV